MKSGRHIVDRDGNPVAVEFDPNKPETHAAAHGYEHALEAGAAFKKLTAAERAARRVPREKQVAPAAPEHREPPAPAVEGGEE